MIKQINQQNISTTPFVAAKSWELFNIDNPDAVALEINSASVPSYPNPPGTLVAVDYVYYLSGTPALSTLCSIALEQQPEDNATYEEGVSGSGRFDPFTDVQNATGTYKRLVYAQISRAFYNQYRNPIEIFGMENIDFPLSQTHRFLADDFKMFTIPQQIFGDKIQEGSVRFYDNSFDDNLTIYDDSYENLVAGNNIFSKVQEVRHIDNFLMYGSASYYCPVYTNVIPSGSIVLIVYSGSAILEWTSPITNHDGWNLQKSLDGVAFNALTSIPFPTIYAYADVDVSKGNTYWYRVQAYNSAGTSSWSNIADIYFPLSPVYSCHSSSFPPQLYSASLSV
jgi:hypothetical protein